MSKVELQKVRGTYDSLGQQSARFTEIENRCRSVFKSFGYEEIRTPILEQASLFLRAVGEATDIVTKEMYIFDDISGEKLALRPEGTAGVVRAYYTNGLKQHLPLKLFYVANPTFRRERPQKGRFRQFNQIGCELIGVSGPMADVEVILTAVEMLKSFNLKGLEVHINSLGTPEDRKVYREKLLDYFEPFKNELSKESQSRLYKNPLRVLDSKEAQDKKFLANAPLPVDFLCDESKKHYQAVINALNELGIKYKEDKTMVRGLDYYTHTVFEVHSTELGAQSQVIGGGRYDGLFAELGSESIPAVGFGCGEERLEMILAELKDESIKISFIDMLNGASTVEFLKIATQLQKTGAQCFINLEKDVPSFKNQMKKANKINANFVIIRGEDEAKNNTFTLKNMATSEQKELKSEDILTNIKI